MLLLSIFLGQIIGYNPDAVLVENCFDMPVHDFCVMEQDEPTRVTFYVQESDLGSFGELPTIGPMAISKYSWVFSQLDFHLETVSNLEFSDLQAKALGGFNHDLHDVTFGNDGTITFPVGKTTLPAIPFGFSTAPTADQIAMPSNLIGGDASECDTKCQHGVMGTMMNSALSFASVGISAGATIGAVLGPESAVAGLVIGAAIMAPIGMIAGYELGMGNFSAPDVQDKVTTSPTTTETTPTASANDPALVPIPKCDSTSTDCSTPNPDAVSPPTIVGLLGNPGPVVVKPKPDTTLPGALPLLGYFQRMLGHINPNPLQNVGRPSPDTLPRPAPIGGK